MTGPRVLRRSVVLGAGGLAAGGLGDGFTGGAAAPVTGRTSAPDPTGRPPLWRQARRRGLVFGSAASTRLFPDAGYTRLVDREAGLLLVEDDLLWYKLRPTPRAGLDFSYADRLYHHAETRRQLVLGAHLVWDEGFGRGWQHDDLWGLDERAARRLLLGTVRATVRRYRGRTAGWIVANEVTDPAGRKGFRTDVPWWNTIGDTYVAEAFHVAHEADPAATLVLNDFGFETAAGQGHAAADRRRATLQVIDALLDQDVPVHALGIQAHLLADEFETRFQAGAYRRWLGEVADRGLDILVTELDCLDDGLPAAGAVRDRGVAAAYRRYLDVALDERAVKAVLTFGLSDRHSWLQEDYPRDDDAPRRPLPFDQRLRPKRAWTALSDALHQARCREPLWEVPR